MSNGQTNITTPNITTFGPEPWETADLDKVSKLAETAMAAGISEERVRSLLQTQMDNLTNPIVRPDPITITTTTAPLTPLGKELQDHPMTQPHVKALVKMVAQLSIATACNADREQAKKITERLHNVVIEPNMDAAGFGWIMEVQFWFRVGEDGSYVIRRAVEIINGQAAHWEEVFEDALHFNSDDILSIMAVIGHAAD